VALIKDSAIRLLFLKLTLNSKSILRQNNRDFTKNNKSINYNNRDSVKEADFNLSRDTRSL
jgi:hypothetical protein